MTDPIKKRCDNPACSMHNTVVTVAAATCLACSRTLKPAGLDALSDLLKGFEADLDNLMGKPT